MIQKKNESDRRVLSCLAVHPCESIAPETLLISLINLARNVCSYKSKFFPSNARNAREAIRQVSNLLVFFDEIGVSESSGLPGSIVLGFYELHLTLQKLECLLEDCTREGARLWMLIKADRVANQFRVLIRAMATGLDVLPIGSLDLSCEVKEVIALTMKQSRSAMFELEKGDERVMEDVMVILNKFEDGAVPDRKEVKRVLDYLGVKKWSDCNKEVKFLDGEIGIEYSNPEKRRGSGLLSSLMGFMCYSRCVLFDSVDNKMISQVDIGSQRSSEVVSCLNSDDFRCPISLEIMKDPVTIETGHSYERCSILKWFRTGNATCPKTGKKLSSLEVLPNLALKQLIQQYSVANGLPVLESSRKNRDITRTVLAGSLAAEGAMKMVARFLAGQLDNGACEDKNKAAYEIRLLSKSSIFNRSCLVEACVIPYLLMLLSSDDSLSQENAMAALLNLSKHSRSKAEIVQNGGLELVVDALKTGFTMEARQHAAATLFYLASIEDYRKLIGESTEAIPALVELIKKGNYRAKKNSMVAIYGLLTHPGNHFRVIASGAVPLLLDLLASSEKEELVTDSLAVLATLAEKSDGEKTILRFGVLPQIVGILDSSTSRAAKEHSVALLLALCINGGEDVVGHLVKNPPLMGSLYSLLNEGTSRASKKASALIRVLHEFYERSSSGSKTPVLSQARSVHVW